MKIDVHNLQEEEIADAIRIFRLAFGTFFEMPNPLKFGGDGDSITNRWKADPTATWGAVGDGKFLGSNLATNWGSVGFFGPLSVDPNLWNGGVGQRLLEPTMEKFDQWGTELAGLFTFPQSSKHVALYQKFGFMPKHLIPFMSLNTETEVAGEIESKFSDLANEEKVAALGDCRNLTDHIFGGLDLTAEILSVDEGDLGDTVLLGGNSGLEGFAVCHIGPGSEAGTGFCSIKFGAVASGPKAPERFAALIEECKNLALSKNCRRLLAGINSAREAAYLQLLARGFRLKMQGVAMQRPSAGDYSHPDAFVIDDWR